MKHLIFLSLILVPAISSYADNTLELVGTKEVPLAIQQPFTANPSVTNKNIRRIGLMDVKLSPSSWHVLSNKMQQPFAMASASPNATASVGLSMNNVPVLDQGPYGSCVLFANTAAINAILNKGDHISQLCQLQLGSYLEKTGYNTSGWNGSLGPVVLAQIDSFGIVSIEQQRQLGCGGLTEYPKTGFVPSSVISPEDFHAISTDLHSMIKWSNMLDPYQRFVDKADMVQVLSLVKKSIAAGDRLTFGVLLFDTKLGVVGAVGKHKVSNDTWILTPQIIKDIRENGDYGGHEMIITGFNDNDKAVDDKGNVHKGLLTLRNSWGSGAGDQGDFYMSYDYFKLLAFELQRIRKAD